MFAGSDIIKITYIFWKQIFGHISVPLRNKSWCVLQVLLNHETGSPQAAPTEPGAPELMRLSRLKLAIKLRQKKVRSNPKKCCGIRLP